MKVYIDREMLDYLVDAHDEMNESGFKTLWEKLVDDLIPLFELSGVIPGEDCVRICVKIDRVPIVLTCPPDIFAGTSDFIHGLNHGLNRDEFDPWGTIFS